MQARTSRGSNPTFRLFFEANCLACHGETLQQNGLDLRTRGSVLKGAGSGSAVRPGSADESLLFEKVLSGSMPVGDDKLSPEEIELIRDWIDSGAWSEGEQIGSAPGAVGRAPRYRTRCDIDHSAGSLRGLSRQA